MTSPPVARLRPRSTHDGIRAPCSRSRADNGVTDQSKTVAPAILRTAWIAKRAVTRNPSLLVQTVSPATGSFGSVGSSGSGGSENSSTGASVRNSPGSELE